MFEKATSGRDAFTFSLHGMKTIASFAAAPAIAQNQISKAWDERLARGTEPRVDIILRIEDFLARYFAPGGCQPLRP